MEANIRWKMAFITPLATLTVIAGAMPRVVVVEMMIGNGESYE